MWSCYLLKSPCMHTYIGSTTNVFRRLRQHNGELSCGAKRTRSNRPWRLLAYINVGEKIYALQLEWQLKKAIGLKKRLEKFVSLSQENNLELIVINF